MNDTDLKTLRVQCCKSACELKNLVPERYLFPAPFQCDCARARWDKRYKRRLLTAAGQPVPREQDILWSWPRSSIATMPDVPELLAPKDESLRGKRSEV